MHSGRILLAMIYLSILTELEEDFKWTALLIILQKSIPFCSDALQIWLRVVVQILR